MKFKTIGEFYLWLKKHEMCILDSGSQGICYKIGNKVYKIFLQFIDDIQEDIIEYDSENILQFSSIENGTYIFPSDVILLGDMVIGYITDYVNATALNKINPLGVDLDKFERDLECVYSDIKIISDSGVCSYDVVYNILYGNSGFKIIDTLEYTNIPIDRMELYNINKRNFNIGIGWFLTYGYFDDFLLRNESLNSMLNDYNIDMISCLREFRNKLSEKEGCKIRKLGDAKKSIVIRKRKNPKYVRELYI